MILADRGEGSRQFYTIKDMSGGKGQDSSYPNFVFLSEGFLITKMKAGKDKIINAETDIGCPLCQQGCLKLHSMDSLVTFSAKKMDAQARSHYKFVCSNSKCQGRFVGGCRFTTD